MLVQQGHAGKGSGARLALILLDIRVGLEVRPEVGAVGEGSAAVGAGKGLLTWGQKTGALSAKPLGVIDDTHLLKSWPPTLTPDCLNPDAPNPEGIP